MAEGQSITVLEVEYRDCPGHPGYRVSNTGIVLTNWEKGRWNRQTGDWRPMAVQIGKRGRYPVVMLKGRKLRAVHRLVLEAFVGPRPKGMCCCHGDGNRENSRLDNLRWDTPKANGRDMVKHGTSTKGERNAMAKLTSEEIHDIRTSGESTSLAAEKYQIDRRHVVAIRRRKAWSHLPIAESETGVTDTRNLPKITADKAAAIRAEFAAGGVSKCALGRKYGVSHTAIHYVVTRRLWKHVA